MFGIVRDCAGMCGVVRGFSVLRGAAPGPSGIEMSRAVLRGIVRGGVDSGRFAFRRHGSWWPFNLGSRREYWLRNSVNLRKCVKHSR